MSAAIVWTKLVCCCQHQVFGQGANSSLESAKVLGDVLVEAGGDVEQVPARCVEAGPPATWCHTHTSRLFVDVLAHAACTTCYSRAVTSHMCLCFLCGASPSL